MQPRLRVGLLWLAFTRVSALVGWQGAELQPPCGPAAFAATVQQIPRRPAMTPELTATIGADCPPLAIRHARIAAAFGLSTDPAADFTPDWSMPLLQTGQRVCDLVEDTIADRVGVVCQHKVDRQFDPPLVMAAQAHCPLRPIEPKRPTRQPIGFHQVESHPPRVRRCECLCAVHDQGAIDDDT